MSSQRTILLTAASGNIGTDLVPLLTKEANVKLVLPTRSAEKLRSSVPSSASSNVVIEEGNIVNPIWLETLLKTHTVDTVFLCVQGGHGVELDTTLNALSAMQRAGTVQQVVYVGICGDYVSQKGIEHLAKNCSAGHMLVKIPIELKLKFGGFGWRTTVLGPTLFFTNDFRSKQAMMEKGVFDEPLKASSRVSTRDIALAARNVMFAPPGKYDGQKIQLGSLKQVTNVEIAEMWSKALGKEVRALGLGEQDWDAFETEHVALWGASFARDVRLMYEFFEGCGFGMSEEEYAVQVEVLGKETESYGEWVREMGRKWVAEG